MECITQILAETKKKKEKGRRYYKEEGYDPSVFLGKQFPRKSQVLFTYSIQLWSLFDLSDVYNWTHSKKVNNWWCPCILQTTLKKRHTVTVYDRWPHDLSEIRRIFAHISFIMLLSWQQHSSFFFKLSIHWINKKNKKEGKNIQKCRSLTFCWRMITALGNLFQI